VLAAIGGIMYVVVVVGSVLFGRKVEGPIELGPPVPRQTGATAQAEAAVVGQYGSAGTLKIPGTVALVGVFFVCFVLYYFVNWKYLSEIWPLR
ncbi:MAG: cytochrome C oxidase subunit I, partial [Gammaproteobacteria bacterium]|nr:cytochrome C oxidase subunit I [Gammaproteobacteria bacterium]